MNHLPTPDSLIICAVIAIQDSILEILRLSSAVVSGEHGKPHVNNECQQMILEIFPSHYPAQHPQHQQQKYFTFKTTVSCHKEKKFLL